MTAVLPKIIYIRVMFLMTISSILIRAHLAEANKSFSKVKVKVKIRSTKHIQGTRKTQANLMAEVIPSFQSIYLNRTEHQIECLISQVQLELMLILAISTESYNLTIQVELIALSIHSNRTPFFSAEMEALYQTIMRTNIGPKYQPSVLPNLSLELCNNRALPQSLSRQIIPLVAKLFRNQ